MCLISVMSYDQRKKGRGLKFLWVAVWSLFTRLTVARYPEEKGRAPALISQLRLATCKGMGIKYFSRLKLNAVLRFHGILSAIEVYLVSDLRLVLAFFSSWKHRLHRSDLARYALVKQIYFMHMGQEAGTISMRWKEEIPLLGLKVHTNRRRSRQS